MPYEFVIGVCVGLSIALLFWIRDVVLNWITRKVNQRLTNGRD